MALAAKLTNFVNHPAGPKTIFFWAPAMKWVSIMLIPNLLRLNDHLLVSELLLTK